MWKHRIIMSPCFSCRARSPPPGFIFIDIKIVTEWNKKDKKKNKVNGQQEQKSKRRSRINE